MTTGKAGISPASFTTFGDLLRYLRMRAGLSQRELAAQVDYHYAHVNRFEKNIRTPDRTVLLARFVPTLGIADEPEWTNRLLELASKPGMENPAEEPEQIAGEGTVFRLPANLTSMIGREQESILLAKLLLQPEIRLLTLIGPPGVGKTSISLHVVERIAHHFAHGAVFVNLTPVMDPGRVIHAFAEALGLVETSTIPSIRVVQTFLHDKNLLMVVDNFEQVLGAAPQMIELLGAAPSVKVLVTSREALRVQGERVFPLSPLPFPDETQFNEIQVLDDFPAVRLFVERASALQPSFQLTKENASLVAEICRRLDGLPLAIELAAARIPSLSLDDMLRQFDRLFDWLKRGRRDTPSWRQTLLGAIEWSYNLLSDEERMLFSRLAVFSGGWMLEAADEVCSDDVLVSRSDVLDLLSHLVDRSLVVADMLENGTRYRFLDTIHYFARSKLTESTEWLDLRNRHMAYFSAWAQDMEALLDTSPPVLLRSRMDAEHNNVHAALEWGTQEQAQAETALSLACATGSVWLRHSRFKEALEWTIRYLPVSEIHPGPRAHLLFLATALSYWRDNPDGALEYAHEGLELAGYNGDKRTCAGILTYLADVYREDRQLELAQKNAEESIRLCREIGHLARLSMALTNLGLILFRRGERSSAQHCLEEALDIAVRENNLWGQSYVLRVQADNLRFDGHFAESFRAFERAYSISSEIDDRISVGMELANLSLLANVLDDHSASLYYAKKAISQFQEIGNEYQQPFPQRMLAYALIQENDLPSARAYCMESLKGNKGIGHKTGIIACLVCLAEIIYSEGNITAAQNLLATIEAEIATHSISLMEPDTKALERLRSNLRMKQKSSTLKEAPLDLWQVLNDIEMD